ncbi:MAG: ParA family protein [Deltaproteobacteria bacterium]|nr:MAG: ParA family protein [Deltaproteobacteria bacterium]
MDQIQIERARLAEVLGLTEDELAREERHALRGLGGPKEHYALAELSAYRRALRLYPRQRECRRLLFLNFKGGTGKTSLSVSVAYRLAEMGYRTLLLDLDSQGHATQCLGYDGEACERTLYDVLVKKAPIEEVRIETPLAELHLVPASLRMATVDLALMPQSAREYKLTRAIDAVSVQYDFVVLDAPPSFGLLNLNAILAADDLYVPVLPDFLSFHGLKLLFETLEDIQEDLEHAMARIFVVINQFNPTTKIARAARAALEEHYAEFLVPRVIRQCTKFAQASSEGVPIFAFDPASRGAEDVQALIDSCLEVELPQLAVEEVA